MIGGMRRLVAVSVLASWGVVSCGILGDKGLPIEFVNRTGKPVVLYEQGRAYPKLRKELAADARSENVWVDSRLDDNMKDKVKYRVEATTQSGDLVFCHDYTFNELIRVGWVVEIRVLNDCPP
jgi:hypothetical protein